jgi:hypothetical protein
MGMVDQVERNEQRDCGEQQNIRAGTLARQAGQAEALPAAQEALGGNGEAERAQNKKGNRLQG